MPSGDGTQLWAGQDTQRNRGGATPAPGRAADSVTTAWLPALICSSAAIPAERRRIDHGG
jgi:hypothetical protein